MIDTPHGRARHGITKSSVRIGAADFDRLSRLARAAEQAMPEVAEALGQELDRARILKDGPRPAGLVGMGCEVTYRDETTGKLRTVTLVFPEEADIAKNRISVMTPIGAALIGLSVGHTIAWRTRAGELKRLTVVDVRDPQAA